MRKSEGVVERTPSFIIEVTSVFPTSQGSQHTQAPESLQERIKKCEKTKGGDRVWTAGIKDPLSKQNIFTLRDIN